MALRLPDFLIIGAAKCGTTSLYRQLGQHPDIHLPGIKEPTFFSANGIGAWERGLDWYSALFAGADERQLTGEASTSYTKAPWYGDAPGRIAATIPDCKLIYMVRDPVQQIISHYQHMVFDEHVRDGDLTRHLTGNDYLLTVANYRYQLDRYLAHFPPQQIHVIEFRQFVEDNANVIRDLQCFLDLEPLPLAPRHSNTRGRRLILRYSWLSHHPVIASMAPAQRQRQLPEHLLRRQPPGHITGAQIKLIRKHLRSDLLRFAEQWDVDISHWEVT